MCQPYRCRINIETFVIFAVTTMVVAQLRGEDWPRFRGPDGSGISADQGLPLEWNATKNIVWKQKLPGPGSSSPITFGDHIYVTCYSGYGLDPLAPGKQADLKRHLVCVNRDSGEISWKAVMAAKAPEAAYIGFIHRHGYASSTPAADESGVYVFYGTSGVAKYNHSGRLLWTVSLGTRQEGYGSASSPILWGDYVIIHANAVGRSLIALDKKSGHEKWRHRTDGDTFSTPTIAKLNGSHELVFHANRHTLAAVDPHNGTQLWSCRVPLDGYQNPIPVIHKGVVYSMGGVFRTAAVRLGGRGEVSSTHKVWELNRGSNVSSPVCYDGHLYWTHENSNIACCADLETGRLIYQERLEGSGLLFYASPVVVDGKIWYVSRENGTYVLEAKPKFRLLAHNTIETDDSIFNGSPAVIGDRMLLRSNKFLYCIGKNP